MRTNQTKNKLSLAQTVFGCAIQQFRSGEVARLLAAAGFDYVFIDSEHAAFDLETINDIVIASVQAGITPLVRVGELHYSLIARALDVGAQGIILPRVESPRALEEAISWMRFPPFGKRGYGVLAPVLDYEQHSFQDITAHLNANLLVVVQFETRVAIERCDELLSVPGIDIAMVGPSDLSISLGVPGQFEHPLLLESVTRLIQACEAHHIVPGIHCRNTALALPWLERGMRLVSVGSELSLLLEKASAVVASMRAAQVQLEVGPTRL